MARYATRAVKCPGYFNRLLTQLFRPDRGYAQTYFDDIFVHSRATNGRSDVDNLINHVRAVLECMRTNKLHANASKCIFGVEKIPFLGCFLLKRGFRADPAKVRDIVDWPVPKNKKDLRKWLGLAISCTSIVRITQIWLGHYQISLRRMWIGVGATPNMRLFKQLRKVSFMRQYWLCPILIDLSVSSVTHLTFP